MRSRVVRLMVLGSLLACSGGGKDGGPTSPPVQSPVLTTVTVALSATAIAVGQSATATASGLDQNGAPITVGTVTWSSAAPATASITASGTVTGVAVGQTQVIASVGGRQGQQTITVTPPPVATVSIGPANPVLVVGTTQQFVATLKDASGSALSGRIVTWSVSDSSKATVNGAGLVKALSAGTAVLTATSEGKVASVSITVTPLPPASVSVSPTSVSLAVGVSRQFSASPKDSTGAVLTGRAVSWSSSDSSVAAVTAAGLVTGRAAGITTITALVDGTRGTVLVTVPGPPGLSVVRGDLQSARSGTVYATPLEVVLRDSSGRPAAGISVRYQGTGGGEWLGGNGWPPVSDSIGHVRVQWTAPTNVISSYGVVARVEGSTAFSPSAVTFTLAATNGLSIGIDTVRLVAGDSSKLTATVDGVVNTGASWTSSNAAVAGVSGAGVVVAKSVGSAVISATLTSNGVPLQASRPVLVTAPIVIPPLNSGAAVRLFPATAFVGGTLTVNLPASPSGSSFFFVVPSLSTLDWSHSQADGTVHTQVSVATSVDSVATPGQAFTQGTIPSKQTWTSPQQAPPKGLASQRAFAVSASRSLSRIPVTARLAYTGTAYAYYEDTTNVGSFSTQQYAQLDSVLTTYVSDLFGLMGSPTDLDGNGKITVLVSHVVSDRGGPGFAYVDECDMQNAPTQCPATGEIVYFGVPSANSDWSSNSAYYILKWYPRNILHESTHVLQLTHAWRRFGAFKSWNAPTNVSEGIAEFMPLRSRLTYTETWNAIRSYFVARDFSTSPLNSYSWSGILNWWLGVKFGDGYPQAVLDAMYTATAAQKDVFNAAIGIAEPEVLARFYASLYFDHTTFGSKFGLEFPSENVPSLLGGVLPPTELMTPGLSLSRDLTYTQGRTFQIQHSGPVRVTIQASTPGAVVLVAQP